MKAKLMVGAAVALFVATLASAPVAYATPQQEKMKACNAEAKTKSLAGDERKTFMKGCLSAKAGAAESDGKALSPQQQKMKDCNAQAKTKSLAGAERKKFMSGCLKG